MIDWYFETPPTESDADSRGCVAIAECEFYPWKLAAIEKRPWKHTVLWEKGHDMQQSFSAGQRYAALRQFFSAEQRLAALLLEAGNIRTQLATVDGAADCYLQLCLAMEKIRNARNLAHKINERL